MPVTPVPVIHWWLPGVAPCGAGIGQMFTGHPAKVTCFTCAGYVDQRQAEAKARLADSQALQAEKQWLICLLVRACALIEDDDDPARIVYQRDGSGGPVSITVARFTCNTYDYAHGSAEDYDRAGTAAGVRSLGACLPGA